MLDGLAVFCRRNGLTVSVTKTKWLVGGWYQPGEDVGELFYDGQPVERVEQFKYLGLIFTGQVDHRDMREARLVAAKKSWGVL